MPSPPRPPTLVALIRGLLIVAVVGALTALVAALTGLDLSSIPPEWRPVAVALVAVAVRTIEGLIDQLRGQAPQAGLLGSAPASATAYIDTSRAGVVADRLSAPLDSALLGADLTNGELQAALTVAAAKLEGRGAAPPPALATDAGT